MHNSQLRLSNPAEEFIAYGRSRLQAEGIVRVQACAALGLYKPPDDVAKVIETTRSNPDFDLKPKQAPTEPSNPTSVTGVASSSISSTATLPIVSSTAPPIVASTASPIASTAAPFSVPTRAAAAAPIHTPVNQAPVRLHFRTGIVS